MINVYVRPAPIKDCVGRADYLTNPKRQENIVATYSTNSDHNFWQALADHTDKMAREAGHRTTCQAREWHGALPNDLSYQYEDNPEELAKSISNIFKRLTGTDNLVVLHWNKKHNNFHFHVMCSENKEINEIQLGAVLTRNTYYNENGKKANKKDCLDENGNLKDGCVLLKKGEQKKTIKRFGAKEDLRSNELNETIKKEIANFLNQEIKQNLYKVYKNDGLHLPTQKEHKGMSAEQIADIKEKNTLKRQWNNAIDEALKKQVPFYMLKEERNTFISENKADTERLGLSISKIKDTVNFVYNKLLIAFNNLLKQEREIKPLIDEYISIKDKFLMNNKEKNDLLGKINVKNKELSDNFKSFKNKNAIFFKLFDQFNQERKITLENCVYYLKNKFIIDYENILNPRPSIREQIKIAKELKNKTMVEQIKAKGTKTNKTASKQAERSKKGHER